MIAPSERSHLSLVPPTRLIGIRASGGFGAWIDKSILATWAGHRAIRVVTVEGRTIKLSNLDKVLYPQTETARPMFCPITRRLSRPCRRICVTDRAKTLAA